MPNLPFDLESKAAARWAAELESIPSKTRARHLYAALKALHAVTMPEAVRLALLESLRPSVFAASEILARDSARLAASLPDTARNTAKLSALLHHEMAAGYERSLSGATPLAGHRIMASLGWMLVRILQLGEPLKPSVWKRLYTIYQQGEIQGWLTQPVSEPLRGGVAETPKDNFKCALAFVALAPARFDPDRISELFGFLLHHRQHIELSDAPVAEGWSLDLSRELGPRCANPASGAAGRLVYLSLHLPQASRLPPPLERRLRHCLGQLRSEDEYPLTRRVDELWYGWESSVAELRRRRSNSANAWLAVPEFELTPLDHDSSTLHFPESSHVYRRLNALLRLCQDDPIAVLETEHARIQPGDLVVLKFFDETLLTAVVRWVKASLQETKTRVGLDLFGEGVECIQVLVVGQGPVHAIAIASAHGGERVLILPPLRLKPGSRVMIGDREAQIARVLEWADGFCAYRLVSQ